MFSEFSMRQFVSAFLVLFAVIDILGSVPVILKLKRKGKKINPDKITLWSFLMFIGFFYIGEAFLALFKLDISSFAIAGSLIIFVMASEMILDVEIFRESPDTPKDSVFVPLVFPLIAGAGGLTTLLSIRAQYADINVLLAIVANMIVVDVVLRLAKIIDKKMGASFIYMLQKFFGIVLLAISVKLFTANVAILMNESEANVPATTTAVTDVAK